MDGIDLSGAVDLSALKDIGPREAEALQAEYRVLLRTRELALRQAAEAVNELEGLQRAAAALVWQLGTEDEETGAIRLELTPATFATSVERIAEFSAEPVGENLVLEVLVKQEGEWTVTDREPTDEERATLRVFMEPPIVTRPGDLQAIVPTEDGELRVAEWKASSDA